MFGNLVKFQINYTSLALLWMSLKAKLSILKNHTFLFLGPSPFEHWFKSYQIIIVGSLHFCDIAPRSSIVFLESPISSALCRACDLCCRPLPEFLQTCAALPSPMSRCAASPTTRAASVGRPPLSHVGPPMPSGCHAPEGHAGTARRPEPGP
jgi:hypothetical protein